MKTLYRIEYTYRDVDNNQQTATSLTMAQNTGEAIEMLKWWINSTFLFWGKVTIIDVALMRENVIHG